MGDSRSPGRKRGKSPLDASGLHLAGWRCCLLPAPSRSSDGKKKNRTKAPECGAARAEQEGGGGSRRGRRGDRKGGGTWKGHSTRCHGLGRREHVNEPLEE